MYHLMASRLWRKQFLDRKPFPSSEKDMPEMIQKVIKEVLGSVFKNKGENDEWWMMINDERWMAMTNVKLEIHSFRNLQRFRFKTSLTNVSMVWLNRAGASNNNEETERITILCGIGSQDSDHFLGPFFWCREKTSPSDPCDLVCYMYYTFLSFIISQMVAQYS